jgi:hypothetical protein
MVKVDALIAEVTRECRLWPAYRPALCEPKSAAQASSGGRPHPAGFGSDERLVGAVSPVKSRLRYETLASMVEIAVLQQDKPPQV